MAAHSKKHYIRIWGILCVLLFFSVAGPFVAQFIPNHHAALIMVLITAFGIAFVKAFLVIKHFMHLTVEKPYIIYLLSTALVFMVLFFAGTAPDVMKHSGRNWENKSAQQETKRAMAEEAAGGHGDHGGHDSHH